MEPLYIDPAEHPELIDALREAFHRVTGAEPTCKAMGATTYAKAFPNALCFGPIYPEQDPDLSHQADECVTIDAIVRNMKIFGLAILLLASERKP